MGIKERFNNFFFLENDEPKSEEPINQKEEPKKQDKNKRKPINNQSTKKETDSQNVVALNQQQSVKKPRITVVEPRMYSEAQEVADILLNNQTVILNFRRMEKDQAKKMIDFLMGTTYAIKGDIQRIGEEIFVCIPQSIELDGADLQALRNQDF